MRLNWATEISGASVTLKPYRRAMVPRYHRWMADPYIRGAQPGAVILCFLRALDVAFAAFRLLAITKRRRVRTPDLAMQRKPDAPAPRPTTYRRNDGIR